VFLSVRFLRRKVASASRPGRVLPVDDEPQVLALLGKILYDAGYDVLVATNGGDAVMKALFERPDVIVLDIRMPGVDGVEALGRIHARDPELPIVMLSANTDERFALDTLLIGKMGRRCACAAAPNLLQKTPPVAL
jgi:two-component system, NtrC family, response regulator GlrR